VLVAILLALASLLLPLLLPLLLLPQVAPGGEPYLLHSKVSAAPAWASPEQDPTHKKGRDGKQRPASSFFQLFRPGGGKYAFNLAGDDKEVQVGTEQCGRAAVLA
jgi:hypothetical protein